MYVALLQFDFRPSNEQIKPPSWYCAGQLRLPHPHRYLKPTVSTRISFKASMSKLQQRCACLCLLFLSIATELTSLAAVLPWPAPTTPPSARDVEQRLRPRQAESLCGWYSTRNCTVNPSRLSCKQSTDRVHSQPMASNQPYPKHARGRYADSIIPDFSSAAAPFPTRTSPAPSRSPASLSKMQALAPGAVVYAPKP